MRLLRLRKGSKTVPVKGGSVKKFLKSEGRIFKKGAVLGLKASKDILVQPNVATGAILTLATGNPLPVASAVTANAVNLALKKSKVNAKISDKTPGVAVKAGMDSYAKSQADIG